MSVFYTILHFSQLPWDSVATIVQHYLKHLETFSNPVVMVMAESELQQVQEYLKIYDLSMGEEEKVKQTVI